MVSNQEGLRLRDPILAVIEVYNCMVFFCLVLFADNYFLRLSLKTTVKIKIYKVKLHSLEFEIAYLS